MSKCICREELVEHICLCMDHAHSLGYQVPPEKTIMCLNCLFVMCLFCHGNKDICKTCCNGKRKVDEIDFRKEDFFEDYEDEDYDEDYEDEEKVINSWCECNDCKEDTMILDTDMTSM